MCSGRNDRRTEDGGGADGVSSRRAGSHTGERAGYRRAERQHIRTSESDDGTARAGRYGWKDPEEPGWRSGGHRDRVHDRGYDGGSSDDPAAGVYHEGHAGVGGRYGAGG